jgi:hypothetical protein
MMNGNNDDGRTGRATPTMEERFAKYRYKVLGIDLKLLIVFETFC